METPSLGPHELDEEGVAAGAFDHGDECLLGDTPSGRFDRFSEGALHVACPDGSKWMSLRSP